MLLKIAPEPRILRLNRVLRNRRQEQETDNRRENAKRRTEIERVLSLFNHIISSIGDKEGEDICPDEGTDLPCSRCDPIVLTADSCCRGFGGDQTDVVSWANFA